MSESKKKNTNVMLNKGEKKWIQKSDLKDFSKRMGLSTKVLPSSLKRSHPTTLKSLRLKCDKLRDLTSSYLSKGDVNSALKSAESMIRVVKEMYDDITESQDQFYAHLLAVDVCKVAGKSLKSRLVYHLCEAIRIAEHRCTHRSYLDPRGEVHLLSTVCEMSLENRLACAPRLYAHLNKRMRTVYPNSHPLLADHLSSMANFYLQTGNYESALSYCGRALVMAMEVLGSEFHPSIADGNYNLGLLYRVRAKQISGRSEKEAVNALRKSLSYLDRSKAIREYLFGPRDVSVADVHISIARSESLWAKWSESGKIKAEKKNDRNKGSSWEAYRCLELALDILETKLGCDHSKTKITRKRFNELRAQFGEKPVSPGDVASNSRTLLQVGAPRGSAVLEALEHNAPYTKNEIFSAIAQIRREWRENAAGGSDSDTMVTPDAVPRFFENKIVSELPKSGQELRAIFVRYSCMLDLVLAQLRVVERSSSPHKRHLTSSPLPYNMSAPNKAFQKYQSGSVAYTPEQIRHAGASLRILMQALGPSATNTERRLVDISAGLIENIVESANTMVGRRITVRQIQAQWGNGDAVRALLNELARKEPNLDESNVLDMGVAQIPTLENVSGSSVVGVAGPLEGVIIHRDHFDGATMSSAAFGVDVSQPDVVERNEEKEEKVSKTRRLSNQLTQHSLTQSNSLELHHEMMFDEDIIGVVRRVADTVSTTTSASPERVARTCAVLAECLGLDPLTSSVAAGYETSIILALNAMEKDTPIEKIVSQTRRACSTLGLPPMVACIVADVGVQRACAESEALTIAEKEDSGRKNIRAIVKAAKEAAKRMGSPDGVDACHAANATIRCLMAGEVARLSSTKGDPLLSSAKAIASMVRVATSSSGLSQNVADEMIEGPICRVFCNAIAEWRYSPRDIGRAARALIDQTGRSTAREIKSAAHAAASAVANMKADEKRESHLVGAAAREACEGCGMSKIEAARTAAEIAMTSVLAANAQDDEDNEMHNPHKAVSGAGLDESRAARVAALACARFAAMRAVTSSKTKLSVESVMKTTFEALKVSNIHGDRCALRAVVNALTADALDKNKSRVFVGKMCDEIVKVYASSSNSDQEEENDSSTRLLVVEESLRAKILRMRRSGRPLDETARDAMTLACAANLDERRAFALAQRLLADILFQTRSADSVPHLTAAAQFGSVMSESSNEVQWNQSAILFARVLAMSGPVAAARALEAQFMSCPKILRPIIDSNTSSSSSSSKQRDDVTVVVETQQQHHVVQDPRLVKATQRRDVLETNLMYEYVVLPSATRALETSKNISDVAHIAMRSAMEMYGISVAQAIELGGKAVATACVRDRLKDLPPSSLQRDVTGMRSIAFKALGVLGMRSGDAQRVATEIIAEIASLDACQSVKEESASSYAKAAKDAAIAMGANSVDASLLGVRAAIRESRDARLSDPVKMKAFVIEACDTLGLGDVTKRDMLNTYASSELARRCALDGQDTMALTMSLKKLMDIDSNSIPEETSATTFLSSFVSLHKEISDKKSGKSVEAAASQVSRAVRQCVGHDNVDNSNLCRANIMATLAALPEMPMKRYVDVTRAAKASGMNGEAARRSSSMYCVRREAVRSSWRGDKSADVTKAAESAMRSAMEIGENGDLDIMSTGQIANLVTSACVVSELKRCDDGTLPPAKVLAQTVQRVSKETVSRLENVTNAAVGSVMSWLVGSNLLSVKEAETYAKEMVKSMGLDENKYAAHVEHHLAGQMSNTMSVPGTAASKAALTVMSSAVGKNTTISRGSGDIGVSTGPPSFEIQSSTHIKDDGVMMMTTMDGPHHVSSQAAMKEAKASNRVAENAAMTSGGTSRDYSKGLAQVFNDGQIVKAVRRLNNGVEKELIDDAFLREILEFARSRKWPNAGDLLMRFPRRQGRIFALLAEINIPKSRIGGRGSKRKDTEKSSACRVIRDASGQRFMVAKMDGRAMWFMLGPTLYTCGYMIHLVQRRHNRRRAAKMMTIGMSSWVREKRKMHRIAVKSLAAGLLKSLITRREHFIRATKMLMFGGMEQQLQDRDTAVRALKVFTLGAIMAQNKRYREVHPCTAKKKKSKPPKMSTFRFKDDSKKMDELSPEEVEGSVWDPDSGGIASELPKLIPLDSEEGFFKDVVSWFRPIPKKPKKKKKKKKSGSSGGGKNNEGKKKQASIPIVEVLPATMQQPVLIGLSKCPPAVEVYKAIKTFDLKVLNSIYMALINTTINSKTKWPGIVTNSKKKQDEMKIKGEPGAWTNAKGEPIKVTVGDSYIMALRCIKNLSSSLRSIQTVCGFQDLYDSIMDRCVGVKRALEGILRCDGLCAMLLLAVRMGNAINGDTPEGKAPRLKRMSLQDLILFTQVKGKGMKKESALFYIVYHLMQNEKTLPLTNIEDDLKDCKECVKYTQMKIEGDYRNLTTKVKTVNRGVETNKKTGDGMWEKNLSSFLEQSAKDMAKLDVYLKETQELYEKVMKKIAWKPEANAKGWENLFTTISEFLNEYVGTRQKCESTFAKEQKERIKKEKEERMKRRKAEKNGK